MKRNFSTIAFLSLTAVFLAALSPARAGEEAEPQFLLRVEFYDVPADEALRIQQEVPLNPNQIEARDKVVAMVKEGTARFVTSTPLVCRHGSRGKYEDTAEVPVIEDFTWNEEAKQLVPQFGVRNVGTIFEVDPTLRADGETLDLNFALEHHTGQPEPTTLTVPIGDTEKSKEVTVTRFHKKKITTKIYLKPGAVALVAAFDVTGPQGDAPKGPTIENPKRLAFLCAEVPEAKVHSN